MLAVLQTSQIALIVLSSIKAPYLKIHQRFSNKTSAAYLKVKKINKHSVYNKRILTLSQ